MYRVKTHEIMVNKALKNYLSLQFLTGSSQTAGVKEVNGLEQ